MTLIKTLLTTALLATAAACAPKAPEPAPTPVAETPAPVATPEASADPRPADAPWYSGGTLHKVSIDAWKGGGAWNRLATSADWALQTVPEDKRATMPDEERRTAANLIMECINEATYLPQEVIDKMTETTADLAVTCIARVANP